MNLHGFGAFNSEISHVDLLPPRSFRVPLLRCMLTQLLRAPDIAGLFGQNVAKSRPETIVSCHGASLICFFARCNPTLPTELALKPHPTLDQTSNLSWTYRHLTRSFFSPPPPVCPCLFCSTFGRANVPLPGLPTRSSRSSRRKGNPVRHTWLARGPIHTRSSKSKSMSKSKPPERFAG